MSQDSVCAVILDHEACQMAVTNEDIALTLIAVASEDPADWAEMIAYWPRYTTRVVPEFASNLPFEIVDHQQIIHAVSETESWIVLDLVQKRFLSGRAFPPITRDACFAMHTDEKGQQHDPLSIHFAPWWELHEQVDPNEIDRPRQSPIEVPFVDRDFLFGAPLIHNLAERILQIAKTETGWATIMAGERKDLYPLTIEVHRAWLMTPHEELGGQIPRQMLHGGQSWLEKVIWGHRLRFELGRGKLIAAPKHVRNYARGPMGLEEMAIYFDLCRELIGAAWSWCKENLDALAEGFINEEAIDTAKPLDSLIRFLTDVKNEWMNRPLEGGSPPAFIIECSRRRVPRGAGVEIVGMDERESAQHLIDCDCPICQMMADGMFGTGFTAIDGHHLELDDEFAFSTCETLEEWEEKQREFAELSVKFDRDREERRITAEQHDDDDDEFASAWSSPVSEGPLPGDASGNLKLAFLLAEIISVLQCGSKANAKLIKQLNHDFSSYRTCDHQDRITMAKALSATLERVADLHPELVSRTSDFQSRIEEQLRSPVSHDHSHGESEDFPF
jgi:hypothetical protein